MKKFVFPLIFVLACGCQSRQNDDDSTVYIEEAGNENQSPVACERDDCPHAFGTEITSQIWYDDELNMEDLTPYEIEQINRDIDAGDRKRLERFYPNTLERLEKNKNLTLQDIKNMTRAGVSPEAIVHSIAKSNSVFYLTPEDLNELKQSGVASRVIEHMQMTGDSRY